MQYEWDNSKRTINLAKHGVDFAEVELFDWDGALIADQMRADELRFVALGELAGRLHVVVYVRRGTMRRIISLRKANRREERRYAESQRVN